MLSSIKIDDEILHQYKTERERGVTATFIAEKTGVPLKEVIAYLIEKEILKGDQIDLELIRMYLQKTPEHRDKICVHLGLSADDLDKLLVKEDLTLKKEIWKKFIQTRKFVIFTSLALGINPLLFSSISTLIIYLLILFSIVLTYQYQLFKEPSSTLDLMLKILEEI